MKQKNRPVTGSLKERNGKYTAVINAYDENGKRQQKYHALGIPVKGNKRKAEAALQEILRQYESRKGKGRVAVVCRFFKGMAGADRPNH